MVLSIATDEPENEREHISSIPPIVASAYMCRVKRNGQIPRDHHETIIEAYTDAKIVNR